MVLINPEEIKRLDRPEDGNTQPFAIPIFTYVYKIWLIVSREGGCCCSLIAKAFWPLFPCVSWELHILTVMCDNERHPYISVYSVCLLTGSQGIECGESVGLDIKIIWWAQFPQRVQGTTEMSVAEFYRGCAVGLSRTVPASRVVVAHAFHASIREAEAGLCELCEFKANLIYKR